jgi:hypothetical protein
VSVDILWSSPDTQGLETLKRLVYSAKSAKGVLRFNSVASAVNSNLILWDSSSGFYGAVSTVEWLGAISLGCGVMFSDPVMISWLARLAAGFWSSSPAEALSSVPDRWRNKAFEVETMANEYQRQSSDRSAPVTKCRFIVGKEHLSQLRAWCDDATRRILIATDEASKEPIGRLGVKRSTNNLLRIAILSGSATSEAELFDAAGYEVRRTEIRGDIIVADDSTCFTKFKVFGDEESKGLGVVLEGAMIADLISERLASA